MIRTARLVLRQWQEPDREPFGELNADPAVMEFFPSPIDRTASDAFIDRQIAQIDDRGWGLWAVEVLGGPGFIGFVGLAAPTFDAPFMPCVEVGWRLGAAHWGRGYAPEAARAAVQHGFDAVGLDEVVSFTYVGNERSRRVMEKIGMDERFEFDHPALPGDRLERHVLYAIERPPPVERAPD